MLSAKFSKYCFKLIRERNHLLSRQSPSVIKEYNWEPITVRILTLGERKDVCGGNGGGEKLRDCRII